MNASERNKLAKSRLSFDYKNNESVLHLQVLEQLPGDLQIVVLQHSPATFAHTLLQLPRSLRQLAVLAQWPRLQPICSATEDSSGAKLDAPVICMCVDTGVHGGMQQNVSGGKESDISQSQLWPCIEVEDDDAGANYGLGRPKILLEQRRSTIACPLVPKSRRFEDMDVHFPGSACLVLGQGCTDMFMERVTFRGTSSLLHVAAIV